VTVRGDVILCIFTAACAQSHNKYVFRMIVLLEERETSFRTMVLPMELHYCSLWFEHSWLNKSVPIYDRIKQGSIYC